MDNPQLPTPDGNGWFEPVLKAAPGNWPWALPYLAAVNIAPDPGDEVVRAVADPNGTCTQEIVIDSSDRTRVEVIGYWRWEFALVDCHHRSCPGKAMDEAESLMAVVPVRYLLRAGKVISEDSSVEVTGVWPEEWTFRSYRHLGSCCAFVYEQAVAEHAREEAEEFRDMVAVSLLPREQVMAYISALKWAKRRLRRRLGRDVLRVIDEALAAARKWLRN